MAKIASMIGITLVFSAVSGSAWASAIEASAPRQESAFRPIVAEIKAALLDLKSLARTGGVKYLAAITSFCGGALAPACCRKKPESCVSSFSARISSGFPVSMSRVRGSGSSFTYRICRCCPRPIPPVRLRGEPPSGATCQISYRS